MALTIWIILAVQIFTGNIPHFINTTPNFIQVEREFYKKMYADLTFFCLCDIQGHTQWYKTIEAADDDKLIKSESKTGSWSWTSVMHPGCQSDWTDCPGSHKPVDHDVLTQTNRSGCLETKNVISQSCKWQSLSITDDQVFQYEHTW